MKKTTLILCLALVLALSLPAFASCDASKDNNVETKPETNVGSNQVDNDETEYGNNYDEIYNDPYDVFEELVSRGYEGTFEEWVASLKGADGKSAYELAVDNGYKGTVEEWLDSLVGASGKDGVDGEKGDQGEQGIQGEKGDQGETGAQGPQGEKGDQGETGAQGPQGEKGDQGETGAQGPQGEKGDQGNQGVSVVDAYVDENLHLWIILSDGTKIDAGYVGVATTEPEPEIKEPTIVVSNATASAGSKNIEITVALKNNPGVTSMLMKIAFDDAALDLVSMTYNTDIGGTGIPLQSNASPISAYWAEGFKNVTGDWVFVTLVFNVSNAASYGEYPITVTYNADDVFNADEINVDFAIINGKITVS